MWGFAGNMCASEKSEIDKRRANGWGSILKHTLDIFRQRGVRKKVKACRIDAWWSMLLASPLQVMIVEHQSFCEGKGSQYCAATAVTHAITTPQNHKYFRACRLFPCFLFTSTGLRPVVGALGWNERCRKNMGDMGAKNGHWCSKRDGKS